MLPTLVPAEPVRDARQLVERFRQGRAPERRLVGMEHEKIAVVARTGERLGAAVPYEGDPSIREILARLRDRGGFDELHEGENVIALVRDGESVTLEPGGQIEHSGPPLPSLSALVENHREHLRALVQVCDSLGVALLGIGFRPFGRREDVPWVPKGRYRVMREVLPGRGAQGLDMMQRTATVQASYDFADEQDCAEKMRTAYGVTSLVTALFAASPLRDGRPAGMESVRAGVWLETDPDRCGLLPFALDPAGPAGPAESPRLFERYVEWALDAPMLFLIRGGAYRPAGGRTFRRFLREGLDGERATLADWELHLSTLFPEVRLRGHLEMRGADCGPLPLVQALPALWFGLLYDADARAAAWSLVADLRFDEREALRHEVPFAGLAARVQGRPIQPLCAELVDIARRGLRRLGQEEAVPLLDPVAEIARTGRTAARAILEAFEAARDDAGRFIEAIRYRA